MLWPDLVPLALIALVTLSTASWMFRPIGRRPCPVVPVLVTRPSHGDGSPVSNLDGTGDLDYSIDIAR